MGCVDDEANLVEAACSAASTAVSTAKSRATVLARIRSLTAWSLADVLDDEEAVVGCILGVDDDDLVDAYDDVGMSMADVKDGNKFRPSLAVPRPLDDVTTNVGRNISLNPIVLALAEAAAAASSSPLIFLRQTGHVACYER